MEANASATPGWIAVRAALKEDARTHLGRMFQAPCMVRPEVRGPKERAGPSNWREGGPDGWREGPSPR